MSSKRRTGRRNGNDRVRTNQRTPAFRPIGPPPPATSAHTAQECEKLAERHPEDREELLLEAADAWGDAGEHDRAIAVYERLLDPESGGCSEPDLVEAFRIGRLWDAGQEQKARAAAVAFRRRHPRHAGAWNFVAEALEAYAGAAMAAEWYTAGVTHVLGAGAAVTVDAVEADPQHYDAEMLVVGRHRVRRLLGEPHDDWDDVADVLHERRSSLVPGRVRPLDELHDPLWVQRLDEHGPAAFEDELGELADRLAAVSPADRGPVGHAPVRTACVLYWPREEFTRLLERRPKAAEAYGEDHADHLRQVEQTLRELSQEGAPRVAVGRATVRELEAYAQARGESPDTPDTRSAYAAELARSGRATDWPPPRNGPCWCDSERKYKKCCGNPALV
ncbi:SEC-C domain-containing protein [Streptomyces yaanensis]|uniref:SEC-C domain-containing protein n=1 Tax=Streptomyces yaanensis TaxID=1142239 RepID=A0ABV7SGF3_9ACTN|nr:SEC-C domain-containing protein [Streptomyces sp. CGMCC 4.7035]WNC01046.1 SEC-C domain-containing protein [Streptomyces sp. CGMCC 4.7035]